MEESEDDVSLADFILHERTPWKSGVITIEGVKVFSLLPSIGGDFLDFSIGFVRPLGDAKHEELVWLGLEHSSKPQVFTPFSLRIM